MIPNGYEITRQYDVSQGITTIEIIIFNLCDGIRCRNSHQGFAATESPNMDGSNGGMEDDFRGIFRGLFIETPISVVDS